MQTINLDISYKSILPPVYAKQRDVGRKVSFVVTDGGDPYNIPGDVLLSVWYSGSSGEGNYSAIGEKSAFIIGGNTVTVELIAEMLSAPGGGNLCLIINSAGGAQIGLWNLRYVVEEIPGMDSPTTEGHYTALSEVAALAAASAAKAQQAAAEALQAVSDAKAAVAAVDPVGAIYLSVTDTDPAQLFGGTWERLKDRFLLGAGDTYKAGVTGGEATHTLTVDEMPSHTHQIETWFNKNQGVNNTVLHGVADYNQNNWYSPYYGKYTGAQGSDKPHNNMPPYLAVYMWKRTA